MTLSSVIRPDCFQTTDRPSQYATLHRERIASGNGDAIKEDIVAFKSASGAPQRSLPHRPIVHQLHCAAIQPIKIRAIEPFDVAFIGKELPPLVVVRSPYS